MDSSLYHTGNMSTPRALIRIISKSRPINIEARDDSCDLKVAGSRPLPRMAEVSLMDGICAKNLFRTDLTD